MKKILIGLDGGGSKTKLVAKENNEIVFKEIGGPSNHLSVGIDVAIENITSLVEKALHKMKAVDGEYYLVLGTAGAGRKEDVLLISERLEKSFTERNISLAKMKIVSDAEITIEAAFDGEPGIILICGTGSIVYGKDYSGTIHRSGGFGKLIGDEGSGYSIGRSGINLISKMLDERIPKSNFFEHFSRQFNINSGADLINRVYKENFNIASVAPEVIELADDDSNCRAILEYEADEVITQTAVIVNKLNIEDVDLVMSGSLLAGENNYSDLVKEKLINSFPSLCIVAPKHPPELGAISIADKLSRTK